ncbi:uncharacterized protein N7459_005238 [Penicillium hispanicum]|uniref:uncharacterized protein n=1 Tax=Penicillium hispanicum TaxID=1080232 RepID=UPI0025400909|nr:uncharacterized protein N7459_005238 [Penicillium hispanicum]KAJ5585438.1 hypothetical protein N7459_005238 [Penicillium hispanicum]
MSHIVHVKYVEAQALTKAKVLNGDWMPSCNFEGDGGEGDEDSDDIEPPVPDRPATDQAGISTITDQTNMTIPPSAHHQAVTVQNG